MKKLLTSLACCAMVLVGGISLAACCGNDSLLDTSGKYVDAEYSQIVEALDGINAEQTIPGYEIRIIMSGDVDGEKADINITGFVDAAGNVQLDTDLYLSSEGSELSSKGDVYYQAESDNWYTNSDGEKLKYSSSEISANPFYGFYRTAQTLNAETGYGVFSSEDTDGKYQISTSGGYTKLRLTATEQDESSSTTSNAYFVMDDEGNFVGFSMTSESDNGATMIMECITTDATVEFPSDLDSYQAPTAQA